MLLAEIASLPWCFLAIKFGASHWLGTGKWWLHSAQSLTEALPFKNVRTIRPSRAWLIEIGSLLATDVRVVTGWIYGNTGRARN